MTHAYVLMPVSADRSTGPAAVWITAAGWAAAAERRFGAATLVSPDGEFDPAAALAHATVPRPPSAAASGGGRRAPEVLITFVKDLRSLRDARRFAGRARDLATGPDAPALVWQQHNLFQYAGKVLAKRLGVPLVVFVDAPIVWEARRWGVQRPGWGRILERHVEGRYLRQADLVLAVSSAVAEEVQRLGVDPERLLVTPCAVDLDRFADDPGAAPPVAPAPGQVTVVWIGSFRKFHGLDVLIDAVAALPAGRARLVLAGDGADRARIEALAADAGIEVVFTGSLTADEVPRLLTACDVGVVTSRGDGEFHYSPLKLREYLAAGLAVVAPTEPDVLETVVDGESAVLYEPGDAAALTERLRELIDDPARRDGLAAAGLDLARTALTWDHQMDRVAARLGTSIPVPAGSGEQVAGEAEGLVGRAGH